MHGATIKKIILQSLHTPLKAKINLNYC